MVMCCDIKEPAIIRGIKVVGIGKKGSKPLSAELVEEILAELKEGKAHPVSRSAFFAALVLKGTTPQEIRLEEAFVQGALTNPEKLTQELCPEAPAFVQEICAELLKGKTLDFESAYRLGKFLFSNERGDSARGLVASALRVRYETPDEYEGLLKAMEETTELAFRTKAPEGEPILQLSEPFDGVDNSYLITPLLADYFQNFGFRVVNMVGRNSGPKIGNTLADLIQKLDIEPISGNEELGKLKPEFGWYIHQADVSPAVDRWVEIRRLTVKRPFLSTLEKFLNPAKAKIVVASAFHPPYSEKMITVAQRAGFAGALVMRNGQEGSLSFPLNRPVKILCSARTCEDEYKRRELELNPTELLGFEIKTDEKLTAPSLDENAALIREYKKNGKSRNDFFNHRVKISCLGLKKAVDWINEHITYGTK